MSTCFNRIHYDPFRKKIFITETINGKRFTDEHPVTFDYYVEDPKQESDITDIYGKKVIKKTTRDMASIRMLREAGVFLCESDLQQDVKFLHQRYEGVELKPEMKDFQIGYLDIENDVEGAFEPKTFRHPINLITIKLSKQNQTYTFGTKELTKDIGRKYKAFASEKEMLEAFVEFFVKAKVDIISGWNVQYDISTIINRCTILGITKTMSPVGKYWQNQRTDEWFIPGIAILDYMQFFKDPKFTQERKESYGLQFIAMSELGEGKIDLEGQINSIHKTDWDKFVLYNIQDVELVEKLENKKKFIELCINIAHKSLIPIDKVLSAISVIEGQILIYLHQNKMVMNDRNEGIEREDLEGGYVECQTGYYEDLMSYDFESLYPNIMIHYNISPETLVLYPENEEGLLKTPLSKEFGIYYKKEESIFSKILKKNFQERKEFKELKKKYEREGDEKLKEYYDSQQNIRKIFLNSFYGIMSNQFFHYYNNNTAKSVTLSGQHIIKFMKEQTNRYFRDYFHKNKKFFKEPDEKNRIMDNLICVLDTDSLYASFKKVKDKIAKDEPLVEWSNKFNQEFISPLFKKLLDNYFQQFGIENRINFKVEKIISKMIVFGKKNYATLTLSNEGIIYDKPKKTITGFSSKRSSTPGFARKKIEYMIDQFFETPDRTYLINKIKEIKSEFLKTPIEDIAFPRGITDYKKYGQPGINYVNYGLTFESRTPIHTRGAIVYNYLIAKHNLPFQPVDSGSKIKYIYVYDNNETKSDVIAFLGKCPDYIKENFKINYDQMFQVSILQPMQKLFDVMGWGEIDIETKDISEYFE